MGKKLSENLLFLELLSAAIWDRPVNTAMFDGVKDNDWKRIVKTANQQAVNGLVADKILSMPPQCLPSESMIVKLMCQIKATEDKNRELNTLLNKISNEYTKLGLPFILLKGQGNAQNYPKPLLRISGDLDLFLYQNGDYEKANQWVIDNRYVYHIDDLRDGHRAYEADGFLIENHKYIAFFERKKYNKLLLHELEKSIRSNNFTEISVQGTIVKLLPAELNAFYIFLHMFFHFIHSGVGFRQFIDWILFLSKNRSQINENNFTELAKSFDLLYPIQLFADTAIRFLDAPKAIFPFPLIADSKYPQMIMEDIFEGGDFGFYHAGRPQNKWGGFWHSYKVVMRKTVRFAKIAPSYMLVIPAIKLTNRLKLTFKEKQ